MKTTTLNGVSPNSKMYYRTLIFLFVFLSYGMRAQVGIGTVSPNTSSMLDITSTDKGLLIPRMTTAQRDAVASPATGLMVFDNTTNTFWYFDTTWKEMTSNQKLLIDADGDTKIEVEKTTDEDKIRFTTLGTEKMYIDNAGVTKIGDISNGNDTKIEADGTVVFEGEAEVWDDLRVSMDKGSSSASLAYSPGESSGGQIWYFRDNAGLETLSFQVQIPHGYKEGTNIYPHLHWTPLASRSGNVEWNLDYTWVNYDPDTPLSFPSTTTSTAIATGPFTARTHLITPLTTGNTGLIGTGKKVSSILICRLWRNSNNLADTYGDDAGLLSFDFHYQIDTVGSRLQFSK
ncbi:MAG: hypothetical protein U1C58_10295 [Flavobacteriaceae bacterium]|nr:hypothetical protein [Flavobacteriaceae bacterium]MDZ4148663.1 hypothetical protein [Flavobacteriaceae bacterium]